MATSTMRAVTRLRANPARLPLHISTPFSISRRSYSSLLQPLALTHTKTKPSPSKRPTLPPPHHYHQHRPFSLQPLLDTALTVPHTLLWASQTALTTIHATTGTPWYVTIPLFALALGLCTRIPTTIYARRVIARRAELYPLGMASLARAQVEIRKQMLAAVGEQRKQGRKRGGEKTESLQRLVTKATQAEARARGKRWGVQAWKDWAPALVVFPFWVAGIEGLRRMCGGPRGLLGTLLYGAEGAKKVAEGAAVGGLEGQVPGSEPVFVPEEKGLVGNPELVEPAMGQEGVWDPMTTYVAEPSMATEGCLWFPDLTIADPLHILPFALSAILVANVVPKTQLAWRQLLGLDPPPETWTGSAKWRLRIQRALLVVGVAVGPLTINMPAALHLYWIASASLTRVQTLIIAKLIPMPKPVRSAKREGLLFVMPPRRDTTKQDEQKHLLGLYK